MFIIGYCLFYFTKGITQDPDGIIATTPFEKHIQELTNKEVKGLPYDSARSGFLSIMGEIQTEASIVMNDSSVILSDEEIERCKQIVFSEYFIIFNGYSKPFFGKSEWDDGVLKRIKTEAQELINMNLAQHDSEVYKDLKEIVQTVDDYYKAWEIANNASRCISVQDIAITKKNADKYKKVPLTNNILLLGALNSAEQNAKKSVINNIVSYCNSIINNWNNYSDYIAWNNDYEKACNRIRFYTDKYNYTRELRDARSRLDLKDTEALRYYTELEQNNNE